MKKNFIKKTGIVTIAAAMLFTLTPAQLVHADENGDWLGFRDNPDNNSVVTYQTPRNADEANLKWAQKFGTGWTASPTPPIVKGDYAYIGVGSSVYMLDKETGEKISECALEGNVGYSTNPMVYGNGKLYIQISSGRIQAVEVDEAGETLNPSWVAQAEITGQTISPITFKEYDGTGYLYSGVWTGENRQGSFFCVNTDDGSIQWENITDYGYYWSGALATDDYVVYGGDDGILRMVDPVSGEILFEADTGGQIRSAIVKDGDYLYFTTKYTVGQDGAGSLCRVDVSSGELDNLQQASFETEGRMSTCTPAVYDNKVYLGISGTSQFDPNSGHVFAVYDAESLGEISSVVSPGYPQAAGLLSNAYESSDGCNYVYFTYNAPPGGIKVFAESGGIISDYQDLYLPDSSKQQYCISPLMSDGDGTIYFKNDSGYTFAVNKIESEEAITGIELTSSYGDGALDQDFDKNVYEYTAGVSRPGNTFNVKLNLGEGASATINGQAYTAGSWMEYYFEHPEGEAGNYVERQLNIAVTDSSGNTRTYNVYVYPTGYNMTLSELSVTDEGGKNLALTPTLGPAENNYEAAWSSPEIDDEDYTAYVNLRVATADSQRSIGVFDQDNKRITPEADGTYKFTFPKAGDYTLTIQVRTANMYVREYTVKLPHTVPEEHA